MQKLTSLSPAQVLLYTSKTKPAFKDLLKYTVMDLIIKRVLKIEKVDAEGEEAQYVLPGQDFSAFEAKTFEVPMVSPFSKASDLKVLFEHYVKMCFDNAGSYKRYVFTRLIAEQNLSNDFKQGFWGKLFDTYALTDSGKKTKGQIESELKELAEKLPSMMENDKEGLKKIIEQLGGNIFLVEGFDMAELKRLDFSLPYEDDGFDDVLVYFFLFDSFDDSFDSHYDSYSGCSGDDSGCSGDSGCSSGCGGCGGD